MATIAEKVTAIANNPALTEELVDIYIERAEDDIKGYCNIDEIPQGGESSVVELAAYYISKHGIENVTGYSENGLSYSFEEGIPQNIRQRLQRFVKGKVVRL